MNGITILQVLIRKVLDLHGWRNTLLSCGTGHLIDTGCYWGFCSYNCSYSFCTSQLIVLLRQHRSHVPKLCCSCFFSFWPSCSCVFYPCFTPVFCTCIFHPLWHLWHLCSIFDIYGILVVIYIVAAIRDGDGFLFLKSIAMGSYTNCSPM